MLYWPKKGNYLAKVHIEGVKKTYGSTQVLHDINLSIEHGEFVVFVGPSGSGKSTLINKLIGENLATMLTVPVQ